MPHSINFAPDIVPKLPKINGVGGQPYRPSVGMMLLNEIGHVLVGKRIDTESNAWQMPQGGLNKDETTDTALWREMREEIGTDKAEILARSKNWLTYDFPPDLAPKLWNGQFSGQIQMWYLMRFTGDETDIRLDTYKPEFDEIKWVPPKDLPDLAIWFKKEIYSTVLSEFRPIMLSKSIRVKS